VNTEGIAGLLTQRGIDVTKSMQGRGGIPEWTPEAAAFACAGLPTRHEYAFRFRYALDDSCGAGLRACLLNEAARLHVEHRWPDRVDGRRWLADLAHATVLIEWLQTRRQAVYQAVLLVDGMHELGGFTPEGWRRHAEPAWVRLAQRLDVWCSIATGHIKRRLREDDAA
jgi:hypothetical protein